MCIRDSVVLFEHVIELETRSVAVVGAAGHVEPANPLTGFPHGFGRTVEDVAIYLRPLKQVFPQDRMALHTGQTLALLNRVRDPVLPVSYTHLDVYKRQA